MSNDVALPRLFAIMGSGETAPTMVKVHRRLLEQLGPAPVPAVLLDTPFGFQENAREIAGRAVTYFRESLRAPIAVTGLANDAGDDGDGPTFAEERLVTAVETRVMSSRDRAARAMRCASGAGPPYQHCSPRSCSTGAASCSRARRR